MALIVEEIWRTRNLALFQKEKANPTKASSNVHARFKEITKVFTLKPYTSAKPTITSWTPPPNSWIKINVDVALSSTTYAIAAVARDHQGDVIFI